LYISFLSIFSFGKPVGGDKSERELFIVLPLDNKSIDRKEIRWHLKNASKIHWAQPDCGGKNKSAENGKCARVRRIISLSL
jgi:hypothetical protein